MFINLMFVDLLKVVEIEMYYFFTCADFDIRFFKTSVSLVLVCFRVVAALYIPFSREKMKKKKKTHVADTCKLQI